MHASEGLELIVRSAARESQTEFVRFGGDFWRNLRGMGDPAALRAVEPAVDRGAVKFTLEWQSGTKTERATLGRKRRAVCPVVAAAIRAPGAYSGCALFSSARFQLSASVCP